MPWLRLSTHLRVFVDLLRVLLVAVDVEPHGGPRAAGTAESEDDAGAIREDEPQALVREEGRKEASEPCASWEPTAFSIRSSMAVSDLHDP